MSTVRLAGARLTVTVSIEPELTDGGASVLLITIASEANQHEWDARVVLPADTLAPGDFVVPVALPVARESSEPVRREVVASIPTPITQQGRERLYRERSRSRDRNGMWGL